MPRRHGARCRLRRDEAGCGATTLACEVGVVTRDSLGGTPGRRSHVEGVSIHVEHEGFREGAQESNVATSGGSDRAEPGDVRLVRSPTPGRGPLNLVRTPVAEPGTEPEPRNLVRAPVAGPGRGPWSRARGQVTPTENAIALSREKPGAGRGPRPRNREPSAGP
jgi:hypothetical protein